MIITANDIKTKGVSYIDKMYKTAGQILISVRGKPKYAIIPIEEYEDMREDQISLAYKNAMEDIKNGDYHTNTEQFFKEVGIK